MRSDYFTPVAPLISLQTPLTFASCHNTHPFCDPSSFTRAICVTSEAQS